MMGPTDPMEYFPTWQLLVVLLFIFALIYGCGRIAEFIVRQLFLCMKYLLLAFIDLYYGDDYESYSNHEDEGRRRKRKVATRLANNELNSNSVLLTEPNGIEKTTVPVETILELDTHRNEPREDDLMPNSSTDDEGNN